MPTDEVALRPAVRGDASALAEIYLAARRTAAMPAPVHSDDEVRRWIAERLATDEAWVAQTSGELVGFARFTATWLDDLYVRPGDQRRGVGTALMQAVQARRPAGFCLWVFEQNASARSFYRRHGLIELESTDGSANEEGAPDIRLAWPGSEPLVFLRRLIDEVDADLGDLLARRVALTRAVQVVKPDTRRDGGREAEIVAAITRRASGFSPTQVAKIVDVIITESLAVSPE